MNHNKYIGWSQDEFVDKTHREKDENPAPTLVGAQLPLTSMGPEFHPLNILSG